MLLLSLRSSLRSSLPLTYPKVLRVMSRTKFFKKVWVLGGLGVDPFLIVVEDG